MNTKTKVLAAAVAVAISASLTALPASAASKNSEREFAATYYQGESRASTRWEKFLNLSTVPNKNVWSYKRKSIKIGNSSLSVNSITVNGVDYIPSSITGDPVNGLGFKHLSGRVKYYVSVVRKLVF